MLEHLTETVRSKTTGDGALDASIKFALKDEGCIVLDATKSPTEAHNEDVETDCTIHMSADDFRQLLEGELDPTTAFMMGRLTVDGDMAVAMKLGEIMKR